MIAPNPTFEPGAPLQLIDAGMPLRAGAKPERRANPSIIRLDSGRIMMLCSHYPQVDDIHTSVVELVHSEDDGRTWSEPRVVYEHPGWQCISMGGFARFSDDFIRILLGRIIVDRSLGGDEPMTHWFVSSIDSRDRGETWSELAPEIRLFPHWTEMYGASNPHPLRDGRWMFACMGTNGRDTGWHAGVTFTDANGDDYTPPVIIAAAEDRNFSDTDVVRLDDGRFLSVSREHVTRTSWFAHSEDEGATWTAIRPTGFKGSNIKLFRLNVGAVLCAYRDEHPERPGVSCSVSDDGGENWRHVGQLYAADRAAVERTINPCGYPDMCRTADGEILTALHTYAGEGGEVDVHLLRLRDLTLAADRFRRVASS